MPGLRAAECPGCGRPMSGLRSADVRVAGGDVRVAGGRRAGLVVGRSSGSATASAPTRVVVCDLHVAWPGGSGPSLPWLVLPAGRGAGIGGLEQQRSSLAVVPSRDATTAEPSCCRPGDGKAHLLSFRPGTLRQRRGSAAAYRSQVAAKFVGIIICIWVFHPYYGLHESAMCRSARAGLAYSHVLPRVVPAEQVGVRIAA